MYVFRAFVCFGASTLEEVCGNNSTSIRSSVVTARQQQQRQKQGRLLIGDQDVHTSTQNWPLKGSRFIGVYQFLTPGYSTSSATQHRRLLDLVCY
jgi:hypothetical protein